MSTAKKNIGTEKEFWSEVVAILREGVDCLKDIKKSVKELAGSLDEMKVDASLPRSDT